MAFTLVFHTIEFPTKNDEYRKCIPKIFTFIIRVSLNGKEKKNETYNKANAHIPKIEQ